MTLIDDAEVRVRPAPAGSWPPPGRAGGGVAPAADTLPARVPPGVPDGVPDRVPDHGSRVPPLSPQLQLTRAILVMVLAVTAGLVLHAVLVGRVQHRASQQRLYSDLRAELAAGTAPIGPLDRSDALLAVGTPVAVLEIPAIDVDEVVVEGTTPAALMAGPGHRRDTPLPGQAGTSVVFGRRATFGAPFARLSELSEGDEITVTHGQGVFEFRVVGLRREGDPTPPAVADGSARLTLATAAGPAFVPDGVLRVDADLVGEAAIGPPAVIAARALPASEQVMGHDSGTLWALALWLQALVALSLLFVWGWFRWGRPHTWIVAAPPIFLVGIATAGEVFRLFPNLM